MPNPVVHWELMSKDPAKVAVFYEKLFGWKIQHRPEMNYRIVDTQAGTGINGGIVKPDREGPWPGNMLFYIAVDDLADYRKKVKAAGGKSTSKSRKFRAWASSRCSPIPRAA